MVYRNGNCGVWICRKIGISNYLKPLDNLRQKILKIVNFHIILFKPTMIQADVTFFYIFSVF
jgi:hypothetical protein